MAASEVRRSVPLAGRVYIGATVMGAAFIVAIGGASLAHELPGVAADSLAVAGIAFLGILFLQSRSFTLAWKGQRLFVSPDEAVLLVAFVFVPPNLLVLVALAASFAANAVLRREPLKSLFNAASYAVSIGFAAHALQAVGALGVGLVPAVLVVPLVVSAINQFLVAGLLNTLAGDASGPIVRPELFSSIAITSVAGITLGFLTLALIDLHAAGVILLVPVGAMFYRALGAEYRHQNELVARRSLARAGDRLVGEASEDAIVVAVHDACRDAFALNAFRVTVSRGGDRVWAWSDTGGWLARGVRGGAVDLAQSEAASLVSAPLHDKGGAVVGALEVAVVARTAERLAADRELVAVVATNLSMALGTSSALASLADARERLRGVLNAARDPILVLSGDGRVAFANPRAQSLVDDVADGDAGPLLARVLDDASASRLAAAIVDSRGDARVVDVETRGGPDSRLFLELALSRIALDDEDDARGVLIVARDITERRRLEREMDAQREAAGRNERLAALGTLVAGVAHEINNPLTYLKGHVELALLDILDAERASAAAPMPNGPDFAETRSGLEKALKGAERIEHVAKALKIVARKESTPRELVALGDVAREVTDLVGVDLPEAVTVVCDAPPEPIVVHASASELHQIVLNLTKNAVDAVRESGGNVRIGVAAVNGHAELVVEDDGPGIPDAMRPQLFTPFHTTKMDGTGLGLSIVHTLVKDHDGDVLVESEAGRGATFRVRLPLVGGDA